MEEALRYESPGQLLFRRAGREIEVAGRRIPPGATVIPLVGSASRDERQLERPDGFDMRRKVQGHLGFGFGVHFCLGPSLAWLGAGVALEVLVPELAGLARSGADPEWVDSFLVYGPKRAELLRAA